MCASALFSSHCAAALHTNVRAPHVTQLARVPLCDVALAVGVEGVSTRQVTYRSLRHQRAGHVFLWVSLHECDTMDVVRQSFATALPQTLAAIARASFVAIDLEFTGIARAYRGKPEHADGAYLWLLHTAAVNMPAKHAKPLWSPNRMRWRI